MRLHLYLFRVVVYLQLLFIFLGFSVFNTNIKMGKRQHQKDKMYLTSSEWVTLYGGKQAGPPTGDDLKFRRLPYDYCSLTLQPFETPYCDPDGNIFELEAIIAFIKKFKKNPVTGKPFEAKDITKLIFHKNAEGEYHCPVLFKTFTKQSHIAAIKKTGNVFSYEAIEQLNIKTKNWKDLLNSESFDRKDIIIIQDPNNINKFNIAEFHHIVNDLKLIEDADKDHATLKNINNEARAILEELEEKYKAPEKVEEEKKHLDKFNAAHYSTGRVAASFTSTAIAPETVIEAAIIEESDLIYDRVKKKGYVRLVTSVGPLNLELHCDLVPKICDNFIKLCQKGYYDNTKFHRSIRHFMIQGGDPLGTGEGGKSIWGKSFSDHFKPNLTHTGRGVLSMANSGPNTNQSQFFITYRSCKHLDNKHSVFGKVVGGLETLSALEAVETDNKDRPIEDLIIFKTQVFVDPFGEAEEQLAQERAAARLEAEQDEKKKQIIKKSETPLKVFTQGIGKYINMPEHSKTAVDLAGPSSKKAKKAEYKFKDFSSW